MKIGFVIGTLEFSGAEKIAKYLISELTRRGNEVGVLLLSREKAYPNMTEVKQHPLLTHGNTVTRVIRRQKAIKEIVRMEHYEVVLSFGVKFNIDVMEALKNEPVKVILCERNDPYNDPHRRVLRWRRKRIYKFADGFVFQTKKIACFFDKAIVERSAVIPNFIETIHPNGYDNSIDSKNIVITARLDDRQKNISMLLRAFKRFSIEYDYKLFLVGDGPDKGLFERYISSEGLSDKVFLEGHQDVYEYLKKAEFFVLTSNYEGMPNSLIEAMAIGLPCISTDCSGGGASYLISNHINGTLISVGEESELVKAMIELARNRDLRKRYSEEAYKINHRLNFERIVNKWMDYIEQVYRI